MSAMTVDRAFKINGSLVEAWMVHTGIIQGPPPSFRDFSLNEAHAATELVARQPALPIPGGHQHICTINFDHLDRLYVWSVMQGLHW